MATLKELVMKRPQGPGGNQDFLEALLEVTNSDIELVSYACLTGSLFWVSFVAKFNMRKGATLQ